MNDGLERLYELQQQDDLIKNISEIIHSIPEKIKAVEAERDGKKSIIEDAKAKLESNLKERRKFELDINVIKEKITKYKEQMNKSTTNKEYQGFITEIKYEENKIGEVEEKIIEKMLESDAIMEEIRASETEYADIAKEYEKKLNDFNNDLNYHKKKFEEEKTKRAELENNVPKNLIQMYNSIFEKKNGKAISYVDTDFCGDCNVKLRPQLISELITSNNIHLCENCGRILYKMIDETENNAENAE